MISAQSGTRVYIPLVQPAYVNPLSVFGVLLILGLHLEEVLGFLSAEINFEEWDVDRRIVCELDQLGTSQETSSAEGEIKMLTFDLAILNSLMNC